jgi:deoxyribodipyrimidine photo-lyase
MTQSVVSVLLLRRDLRLSDQPAVLAALKKSYPVIPLVLEDPHSPVRPRGAAAQIFYEQAVESLNKECHGAVRIVRHSLEQTLKHIQSHCAIAQVFWNKGHTPAEQQQDKHWLSQCEKVGVTAKITEESSLLWDPAKVRKIDGTIYKVFTPFYKKGCLELSPPPRDLFEKALFPSQSWHQLFPDLIIGQKPEDAYKKTPAWAEKIRRYWDISEEGAKKLWKRFVQHASATYKEDRNRLDLRGTTELSPYLACGIVSAHQLWHAAQLLPPSKDRDHFCSELGWREFSHYLLHHFPSLHHENWNQQFNNFPWADSPELLARWQKGQTGIPIVDAGMRQMWETGYMHNRARMIVGSFLVKNLLLPWQQGEQWFWDCLVDADIANNAASWQWVAGSGADAAPYFRIFNPVLQAEKFDPEGHYVRQYVKELQSIPARYLVAPWEYQSELARLGVVLGQHYPEPCVCLSASREKALQAYNKIKKN